jgi:tetratricopeptide (TPR) repeat protein
MSASFGSNDPKELLDLAREKFIAGEYNTAESIISQILPQNSQVPELYQMLATIYYNKGQFNKAIKTFKRALEIDPNYTDASVGLSIILNDLGRYEEGKKIFIEAQARLDQRNSKSDPVVNDKLSHKYEEIADFCCQSKRYNEALENLERALTLAPKRLDLFVRMADCHLKMNSTDKAYRILKQVMRENPNYIPAKNKLGVILYNKNQIAEAIEQWEGVLMIDPKHPEALRYLRVAKNAGVTDINL